MRTLWGRIRHPRRTASVPITATGTTGAPVSSASRPTPRLGLPSEPGRVRVPSGKISTMSPRSRIALAVVDHLPSPAPRSTGNAPERVQQPGDDRGSRTAPSWRRSTSAGAPSSRSRTGPGSCGGWRRRSPVRRLGMCSRPIRLIAEVDVEERLEDRPDDPVHDRIGAPLPRAPVKAIVIHRTLAYPAGARPLQLRVVEPGHRLAPAR